MESESIKKVQSSSHTLTDYHWLHRRWSMWLRYVGTSIDEGTETRNEE